MQTGQAKVTKSAIPTTPNYLVFVNENGKFYRAEIAKSPADSIKTLATPDMIAVLTDEPISQEDMIGKIIHLGNERAAAVLAPIPNPVEDGKQ